MTTDDRLILAQVLEVYWPESRDDVRDRLRAADIPHVTLDCEVCSLMDEAADTLSIDLVSIPTTHPVHSALWAHIVRDLRLDPETLRVVEVLG